MPMDPTAADARLSNYRLERLLGSGGMGTVYLARDLTLDRPVAIKFIAPDRPGDDSSRRRLIREARAAAALDHPNICGVHEVIVEPDGRACIVMQYIDGQTLAEKLRAGALDVRLGLSIATDMAAALTAAHGHGIIHRDIKPQNIILGAANHARLLDFGIALQGPASDPSAETLTNSTMPGAVAGTLAYMSPEQVAQRPLDARSDLFSLGTVLFECLTGQRPFTAPSSAEIASRILHDDPPPTSSLRHELTAQHDELCRRLLAKHPDDRFQSAEELLGALRMLSGSAGSWPGVVKPSRRKRRRWQRLGAAVASVAVVASIGVWRWNATRDGFVAPPEVQRLYERGTEAIRDGGYHSGRRLLDRAVALAPGHVPAYVKLAEACSELDDHRCAQDALNTVGTLTPDEHRLSSEDRLRVRALRALMLRRVDDTVAEYGRLAELKPNDAGSWLDLGRAEDAAALPLRARASFERAIQLDPENAAAHLRRATVVSQLGDSKEALQGFDAAEALYRKFGNVEGHTEALLRRGTYLNGAGLLKPAREALETAVTLSQTLEHREQSIRARLQLSSVTASEGAYGEAQDMATQAVQAALTDDLDTVAAEGLMDLANALVQTRLHEAPDPTVLKLIDVHLERAIVLAERRNAQRLVARATMQRAALLADFGQPARALEMANGVLTFLRTNHYRRYELQLLLIMSRSLEHLGRNEEGRQISEEGLRVAEQSQDESQAAFALENLAGFAVAAGDLPTAEGFRKRAESINRRQDNHSVLAYDLTNRAELLIRLGRGAEADPLLAELETGAGNGIEAFKERERRAEALKALRAAIDARFADAARIAGDVVNAPAGTGDSAGKLAAGLLVYAQSRLGQRVRAETWRAATASAKEPSSEARYWTLYARLLSGDARVTLAEAIATLPDGKVGASPELEWRLASLGAAAARQLADPERAASLSSRAADALARLRAQWKDGVSAYQKRQDLMDLSRRSGADAPSQRSTM